YFTTGSVEGNLVSLNMKNKSFQLKHADAFSLALITIVHCPEFLHFPKPFLINSHGFLQKWDPNLKLVAEGYAAKCIWNHNPDLEDTGENLFAGTGSLDPREAMEKWFLEHLDYDFQNNTCDEDKMCGHYTQMVWADTHRVGCAYHLCNSMEGLEWERVSFLVCNYYPPGNYEGERPYVEGDWCSRCPEKLQKCENNLCGRTLDSQCMDQIIWGNRFWSKSALYLTPAAVSDEQSQLLLFFVVWI
uniref:SCP domain-containing protein n=1 Tax=Anabas testudineus TaxID=64144 RepID=A0A7N6BVY7_ANATE